ncbi:hypothetical protein RTBOTA2_004765, partial [Rhodotorula toruloides]
HNKPEEAKRRGAGRNGKVALAGEAWRVRVVELRMKGVEGRRGTSWVKSSKRGQRARSSARPQAECEEDGTGEDGSREMKSREGDEGGALAWARARESDSAECKSTSRASRPTVGGLPSSAASNLLRWTAWTVLELDSPAQPARPLALTSATLSLNPSAYSLASTLLPSSLRHFSFRLLLETAQQLLRVRHISSFSRTVPAEDDSPPYASSFRSRSLCSIDRSS